MYSLAVLRIQDSEGIHNLGTPQWQLILCIAFVYCLLYLSLFKVRQLLAPSLLDRCDLAASQ